MAAAAASAAAARVLCEAADAGNLAELRRALDGGADPNALAPAKTADGEECETTALVNATGNGQLEVAALLLDRGASPDKPNSRGCTPLMSAAIKGHASLVGLLVECGADLTATSPEGWTAFHCACTNNNPGCVETLVRAGCDMTATDTFGLTGKQTAEKRGCTAVLEYLRDLVAKRLGGASWEALHNCWLALPFPLSH